MAAKLCSNRAEQKAVLFRRSGPTPCANWICPTGTLEHQSEPMACSVCVNERHRNAINQDMVEGLSLRVIGRKYGIGIATLSRHRAHIPEGQKEAAVVISPSTGSVIDQLKELIGDSRRVARKAETSGHLQAAVSALKTIGGHLELLARLTGELDQPANTTTLFTAVWFDGLVKKYSSSASRTTVDLTPMPPKEIK